MSGNEQLQISPPPNMDKLFETDKMRYHVIFIPSLLGSQLLALASIDKRTNPATIDMVSHAGPHCCCGIGLFDVRC